MMHVCWHRMVAETKTHVYFECRCGSRRAGARLASRGVMAPFDNDWLAGAQRSPR